ncbi:MULTISPECIES: hypothetical protein [Mesorhizobium]|uniref:DUF998 domain-containing protein n=2 Tax=Mesorhizobium TaxID=68287 RepID=A0A1A5IYY7_RHILI|nr:MULTISPECIES: hypothetical protein [Mesorhizobium]MBE1710401.1 hypothetical protein [Mesorhizobium japonicum]MBE1712299.1 hypothetical protein [Mesorhizobium japonicum]MUT22678.1 hypothetical protein [Mesorhizobium japonicum]MUT31041.1 hypothetical protein [Mesorhizobium japonicum]OBP73476.1 hypothetical protein BAE42_13075 [Mesorhizobium loti]
MRSTFLRAAALAWAALSLLLAVHWFAELGMVGFPDGYVTPFARATGPLLHLLASACLIQGLYFLCRALLGKGFGVQGLGLQILIAAILTVAPTLIVWNCPHSQTCSSAYEALTNTMMDDGIGG